VTGVTSSRFQSLLAIALFIGSRAFVDYSTSGLENPLTNLLIVGYLILLAQSERRGLLPALILASMALVNRLDLIWLLGPSAAVACVKQSSKRWPNIALAALPIIVWEAFSIVYYGFAVPNTAYAKVQTGIGEQQLLIQGVR